MQTAVADRVVEAFVIEGGARLAGTVRAAGNKNGALPILAACLLTDETVTLSNVPHIRDVDTMVSLLSELGADVIWTGPNELRVNTANVTRSNPDAHLCSRIRASFLLAGPLVARFGRASVMATENTVMLAVLTSGETVIGNAACEPHVQDLCRFLVSLGASIEGIESNVLRIAGVEHLRGGHWRIGSDHIEVGSFIGMAALTGGDVTIVAAFARLGIRVELRENSVHVPSRQQLVVEDDLGGMIPKIEDGPWPAFPSDLTSVALTIATQAFGTVLMFEKMFENRLFFTDKLVSMGARIILCDPHRAVVTGPARLVGQRMESPDIRAGMAMLLAALAADGQSTIGAAHQIDKGYERIDDRLRALGASIERIER